MRPHEETEPPDPLRGFRTFVVVAAAAASLAVIVRSLLEPAHQAHATTTDIGWLVWFLALSVLPLLGYHRMVRSPSGSVVLGVLLLVPSLSHLAAAAGVDWGPLGLIAFWWMLGPGWLILLLGLAAEVVALYPGYEERWQAARWQERLRLEEPQEVGRSVDR